MDSDMVVALPPATADGRTLLGHRSRTSPPFDARLAQLPGRAYAFGETLRFGDVLLPQARHTYAVLGAGLGDDWGLLHGVNACGLAVACLPFRSRLALERPGLGGPDLVRLALERCRGAHQAVELVADLITRHGQGMPGFPGAEGRDTAFLLADAGEAFLLAGCGGHWAEQEIRQVRAVGGVCHLRQDWDRVSRGLADLVIGRGWWPQDGSKIDFEGTVGDPAGAAGLRRWGRTTLLLEEQNGRIDLPFLRRLLADGFGEEEGGLSHVTLIAQPARGPEETTVAWCGLGPPEAEVSFPLLPDGEVPAPFRGGCREEGSVREALERLAVCARSGPASAAAVAELLAAMQARLDREAREFQETTAALRRQGDEEEVRRQAALFMQHQLERFEDVLGEFGLTADVSGAAVAALPG
jgi:hypothetical protein